MNRLDEQEQTEQPLSPGALLGGAFDQIQATESFLGQIAEHQSAMCEWLVRLENEVAELRGRVERAEGGYAQEALAGIGQKIGKALGKAIAKQKAIRRMQARKLEDGSWDLTIAEGDMPQEQDMELPTPAAPRQTTTPQQLQRKSRRKRLVPQYDGSWVVEDAELEDRDAPDTPSNQDEGADR